MTMTMATTTTLTMAIIIPAACDDGGDRDLNRRVSLALPASWPTRPCRAWRPKERQIPLATFRFDAKAREKKLPTGQ